MVEEYVTLDSFISCPVEEEVKEGVDHLVRLVQENETLIHISDEDVEKNKQHLVRLVQEMRAHFSNSFEAEVKVKVGKVLHCFACIFRDIVGYSSEVINKVLLFIAWFCSHLKGTSKSNYKEYVIISISQGHNSISNCNYPINCSYDKDFFGLDRKEEEINILSLLLGFNRFLFSL